MRRGVDRKAALSNECVALLVDATPLDEICVTFDEYLKGRTLVPLMHRMRAVLINELHWLLVWQLCGICDTHDSPSNLDQQLLSFLRKHCRCTAFLAIALQIDNGF